jgi:hypothetical protein
MKIERLRFATLGREVDLTSDVFERVDDLDAGTAAVRGSPTLILVDE